MPHQLSEEDHFAERFYMELTSRLPSGRYQMRLPFFKNSSHTLGNSLKGAMSRFFAIERKFVSNSPFKSQYVQFITDYVVQGHMSLVSDPNFPKYFIPHRGIFKVRGDTSKIRVVFDASMKTSSGISLNDVLCVGPKLQTLLSDVLTLFRRDVYKRQPLFCTICAVILCNLCFFVVLLHCVNQFVACFLSL